MVRFFFLLYLICITCLSVHDLCYYYIHTSTYFSASNRMPAIFSTEYQSFIYITHCFIFHLLAEVKADPIFRYYVSSCSRSDYQRYHWCVDFICLGYTLWCGTAQPIVDDVICENVVLVCITEKQTGFLITVVDSN